MRGSAGKRGDALEYAEPQTPPTKKRTRLSKKARALALLEPFGWLHVVTPPSPFAHVNNNAFWGKFRPPRTYRMPQRTLQELYETFQTLRKLGYSTRERVTNGLIWAPGRGNGIASSRIALEIDTEYPKISSNDVNRRIEELGINNGSQRFDITLLFGPQEEPFSCLSQEPRDPLINLAFVYLIGNPHGQFQVTQTLCEPVDRFAYSGE